MYEGKMSLAHRISYEIHVGLIPEGMTIDHLCRVRHCFNPNHLEVVTLKENLMRGDTLCARNSNKTHCDKGHEFTPENTFKQYRDNGKGRACRRCHNDRRNERRAKARVKQQGIIEGPDYWKGV